MQRIPTTLVLGATGKTGGRVADALAARGWPVRRGSRAATPAFDWEDATTWSAALEGVDQVYLTFQPDLAMPGAVEAIRTFTDLAVDRGVSRLVLLSGRGEPAAQACERIVQQSGLGWTVVRAGWFMQNFSEGHLLGPVLQGVVKLPVPDTVEAFVDVDDIAEVAVAALTDPRHDGEVYEVTGPRLVWLSEAVATVAAASGREVRFESLEPAAYVEYLVGAQVPRPLAAFLADLFPMTLDGRNTYVTDGVQRALGRPPRDFTAYARDAAAAGAWRTA
ncbi:MAG: NAD(P)H-binding protein [Myxococcota bacterium]